MSSDVRVIADAASGLVRRASPQRYAGSGGDREGLALSIEHATGLGQADAGRRNVANASSIRMRQVARSEAESMPGVSATWPLWA
jgi:hypothetical protein